MLILLVTLTKKYERKKKRKRNEIKPSHKANVLQVGTDERFFKIKLLGKAIVK